jgi:hypothetical protein
MSRTLRWITATTTTIAATALSATPAAAAGYSAPLRTAVANLTVATEVRTGYDRDLFPHWNDADGDGCNTRYEVLIAEATTAPTVSASCKLTGGRWYSWYDNVSWTNPADLDVDHFVPLAEAWDSGARAWTTSRRQFVRERPGRHPVPGRRNRQREPGQGRQGPRPVDAVVHAQPVPVYR